MSSGGNSVLSHIEGELVVVVSVNWVVCVIDTHRGVVTAVCCDGVVFGPVLVLLVVAGGWFDLVRLYRCRHCSFNRARS